MKRDSLQLSKAMVSVLESHGITTPTPIQEKIVPAILEGRDVIAQSETGSGKTLSFAVPVIEKIFRRDGLRALVVVPTRELAAQITDEFIKFSHGKHLGVTPVYGGVSLQGQMKRLPRTNIVVGTPGRLLDLLDRGALHLESVKYLILDEADRMLDMGFIRDIQKIINYLPRERQTLLFSATMAKEIVQLSQKYMHDPLRVELTSTVKPEFLRQTYYQTTADQKLSLLVQLLRKERDLALVFCNRKHITDKIARRLSREGIAARCLNGDMSQSQRERAKAEFGQKRVSVLVATDVAARGLHIDGITHVYNYEIPRDVDSYTHRVGRTARAGKRGEAISFVESSDDRKFFKQILFSYKGSIALKQVDVATLPKLAAAPAHTHGARPAHHGRDPRRSRHRFGTAA